jgi:hypothetical protein
MCTQIKLTQKSDDTIFLHMTNLFFVRYLYPFYPKIVGILTPFTNVLHCTKILLVKLKGEKLQLSASVFTYELDVSNLFKLLVFVDLVSFYHFRTFVVGLSESKWQLLCSP